MSGFLSSMCAMRRIPWPAGMALPWFGTVMALSAATRPLRVVENGRTGFIAPDDGRLLAEPQYGALGAWREGRLWVEIPPQAEGEAPATGMFLDERAQPLAGERYHDLSAVLPAGLIPATHQDMAAGGDFDRAQVVRRCARREQREHRPAQPAYQSAPHAPHKAHIDLPS